LGPLDLSQVRIKEENWAWGWRPHLVKKKLATDTVTILTTRPPFEEEKGPHESVIMKQNGQSRKEARSTQKHVETRTGDRD
jgi:hypothetical protein